MATQANGSRMDRTIVSSLACPIVSATWKMSESFHLSIWVFSKIGVPQNGWFILENLIEMDDLGVPLFFGNIHVEKLLTTFSNKTTT